MWVFVLCLVLVSGQEPPEEITVRTSLKTNLVETKNGKIRGISLKTSQNASVDAFLGIPYAEPPIGELRFRPPKARQSWGNKTLEATKQPGSCLQRPDLFFADFDGAKESQPMVAPSEDCLYLNVFVPQANKRNDRARDKLAVIVYIHGGFFASGSSLLQGAQGEKWISDPRELASIGNVIVVTVQYRLGSFGFLFFGDQSAPGNVGLADQKLALEWVKENVESFGGDSESITVAGQGAGGVSAFILYQNTNLFSKIILQSAGIQHPWSYVEPTEAFKRTLRLAELVGCPTTETSRSEVIECLRQMPADQILSMEMGASPPSVNFSPFVITKDGETITEPPITALKRLKPDPNLRVLMGSNLDEGTKSAMYFLPRIFPNGNLGQDILDRRMFQAAMAKILPLETPAEVTFLGRGVIHLSW